MSRSAFAALPIMLLALLLALLSSPHEANAYQPRRLLQEEKTIASAASGVDSLTTLVAAVMASPKILEAATNPETAVTVFAPTNGAFERALAVLGMTAEELLADTQTLTNILEYHIVPTKIRRQAAKKTAVMLDTLLPTAQLSFSKAGGKIRVNDATGKTKNTNIDAGNSIIHVIDEVLIPPMVPTIASTAEANSELLSTLLAAVKASPPILAAATDPHTEVTVFAPTNEAFATALEALGLTAAELLADEPTLTRILSYHIVPGIVPSSAATDATQNLDTLIPGATVAVMKNGSDVMVNDAKVVAADVAAGLSVVHVIDKVLLPPANSSEPVEPEVTIAEVAGENSELLSTLLAAVMASPTILAAATDPNTEVTVFAPTNEAFAAALEALGLTAEELLSDEPTLTRILSYHIVPMVVPSTAATDAVQDLDTLLPGATVAVIKDGADVMVNNAKVVAADVQAGLSVVHVIDKVLMPPEKAEVTIASTAEANSDLLSTLLAAVKASPTILAAATDPNSEFTVFAPTNEAFEAALEALGLTAEELLSDEPTLTRILSYHIVPGVVPSSAATDTVQNLDTILPGASVAVMMNGSSVMVNDATVIAADVDAGRSVVHVIDKVLLPPTRK